MTVGVGADGVGITTKLRRYWDQRLWGSLFHTLLNASAWPAPHHPPWETLQDALMQFLASHGTSAVRLVLQQLRGMLHQL